jgi:hypothetical protein
MSREDEIINRVRKTLIEEGHEDVVVLNMSDEGPGDYGSWLDYLIDRKLEGLDVPTAKELFCLMKRQMNGMAKTIMNAARDYNKLAAENMDLRTELTDRIKGR